MATMHDAVRRLTEATQARRAAHAAAVASTVQDRPAPPPPAGRPTAAGSAFPIQPSSASIDGDDPAGY